jgi:hypothetical protein
MVALLALVALFVLSAASLAACAKTASVSIEHLTGTTVDSPGDEPRHRLTMRPDALVGQWETVAHFTSRPTSSIPMDLKASVLMRFRTTTETSLDVFLESIGITGEAGGKPMELGPISSTDRRLPSAFDTSLSTITFGEEGPTLGTPNAKNPLARQGHNLIHTAVFSIPAIPATPVGVGASWRARRVIPRSSDAGPEVLTDIHFTLLDVAPCASGSEEKCATIQSKADTGVRDETHTNGSSMKVKYTLEGVSRVKLGGGLLHAELGMTMELELDGMQVDLDGTVTTRMP